MGDGTILLAIYSGKLLSHQFMFSIDCHLIVSHSELCIHVAMIDTVRKPKTYIEIVSADYLNGHLLI